MADRSSDEIQNVVAAVRDSRVPDALGQDPPTVHVSDGKVVNRSHAAVRSHDADRNRLICWPVLPKDYPLETPMGRLIDHITLELSNGETHTTAFDPNGKRHHKPIRGKIKDYPGTGLAPWFSILVKWSVIESQDLRVETAMLTPADVGPRREAVFRRMAEQYRGGYIALPDGPRAGDYVYTMFCLQTSETVNLEPLATDYIGQKVDDRIDGFPDGTIFPIQPTKQLTARRRSSR